jgi:hypothetical protein
MSALDAARECLRRGWPVLPVPYGTKIPVIKNWPALRLTEADLEKYFSGDTNIGLILGEASGLLDVDLDCDEARALADDYLPPTLAKWGRPGAPNSHRLYYGKGVTTQQHRDPKTRKMIVELRSTGCQSLIHPSVHPSGEVYTPLAGEPDKVYGPELACCIGHLSEAVIEMRYGEAFLETLRTTKAIVPPPPSRCVPDDDVERRAIAYLAKMPPAISGQGGHAATYGAAVRMAHGFGLSPDRALQILLEHYNPRCVPPWTVKELEHKVNDAVSKQHLLPDGWLRDRSTAPMARPTAAPQGESSTPTAPTSSTSVPGPLLVVPADKLEPVSLEDLVELYPSLRTPVIHGLLREGETMNVIAASKIGKSWLVNDLALAIALGIPWLGMECERGDVLILDNELHGETSANRLPKVSAARGIQFDDVKNRIFVQNLRGQLRDLFALAPYFMKFQPGRFKLIIIDAFYRVMPPDTDENSNATMASVYNRIDAYADYLKCCFVLIHHTSKGSQAGKDITDVGAGAGSQSRATDTHLILRKHEENDAVVMEAAVRSWPPVSPICLRWAYPVWTVAPDLDPAALRKEGGRAKGGAEGSDSPAKKYTTGSFVERFLGKAPQSLERILERTEQEEGLSTRRVNRWLKLAEEDGIIFRWEVGPRKTLAYATDRQPETEATKEERTKRSVVEALLRESPDLESKEIAERCGASEQYVRRLRRELK